MTGSILALVAASMAVGTLIGYSFGRSAPPSDRALTVGDAKDTGSFRAHQEASPHAAREPSAAPVVRGPSPFEPKTLLTVSGHVMNVGAASFAMQVESWPSEYSSIPEERTVMVDAKTSFAVRTQKDASIFMKELQDYDAKGRRGSHPMPYVDTKATLADVRPGIVVEAMSGEDIKEKEQFTASAIVIGVPVFMTTGKPSDSPPKALRAP